MADRNAQITISVRNDADPEIRKLIASFQALIKETRDTGASQLQAEKQALAHAQALARLSVTSGQAEQGEKQLSAALAGVNRDTIAAIRAETQLVAIQNKIKIGADDAEKGLSKFRIGLSDVQNLVSTFGIGVGIQQLISGGVAAGDEALQLRETKNSLRAVAGDTEKYTTIIQEAKRQQLLFGGGITENIDGLTGLSITARSTGADLKSLVNLQQRLAVLNPAQGAQGGLIALNEALAGNVSSLSRRFNIPKELLRAMADEAKPAAEKLKVLDNFLNSVGITANAVAGRVDQNALAFRRLGQETGDLRLSVGDGLATSLSGTANGLARLLGVVNSNPQAIAELRGLLGGKGTIDQGDIDRATRDVSQRQVQSQLGDRRAQFVISQRLGGQEQYAQVVQQLTDLRVAGGDAAASGERLTQQFLNGAIQADVFRTALLSLLEQQRSGVDIENFRATAIRNSTTAVTEARERIEQFNAGLGANAAQAILAQAQTQILKDRQNELANDSILAAKGLLGSGDQALLLVKKYGIAEVAARELIAAQRQVAALGGVKPQQRDGGPAQFDEIDPRAAAIVKAQTSKADEALRKAKELAAAKAQLEWAQATTPAARIALLQREQQQTNDPAEKLRLEAQIIGERNSLASSATKIAKEHASELNKQLDLTERIRDSEESRYKAALSAQELAIKDRQERRKEERELAAANRILNSPTQSADFRAAAADKIALISIARQQRALQLSEQQATAGGSIVNGKIYQTLPGNAQKPAVNANPFTITAAPETINPPSTIPTNTTMTINLVLPDGRVLATAVLPHIYNNMRQSLAEASSSGTGRR